MLNINNTRLKANNKNKIMLYSADVKLTMNHVNFWIETIVNTNFSFSLLVRDENSYKKLMKEFPLLQVCYAKTPVDVETIVNAQPYLELVLYTSNVARNIHILRFNHLKHVFIGTKNSDWLSHYNKSYRAYDEFWASGEYVVNKIKNEIENIGHLKFNIIGKPQLKENMSNNYKEDNTSLIFLDGNESLLEQIYFANKILDKKMYIYLSSEKKAIKTNLLNVAKSHNFTNKLQVFSDKGLFDDFAKRVSLIIVNFKNLNPYLLQYNVPLVVYIEKENDKYLIDTEQLRESIYCFSNKNELVEILKYLDKEDILKTTREKNLDQFFNQEAILNNNFLSALQKCMKN